MMKTSSGPPLNEMSSLKLITAKGVTLASDMLLMPSRQTRLPSAHGFTVCQIGRICFIKLLPVS
jgi:hypothetical protein